MSNKIDSALTLRLVFSALLIVFLNACSHNPFNKTSTLDWLLENQRYDEAITLYPQLEQDKQASFDLQEIESNRYAFIRQALKNTRREIAKKNWLDAQGILDEALLKTPSSHSLQTEIAVLKQRMSKLEADYLLSIQLLIAQQYIQRQPLDAKWTLVSEDPIPYVHPSLSNQHRRAALAETLGEHGLSFSNKNAADEKQAKEFLQAASALSDDARWTAALNKINQKKAKKAKKAKKKQQKIRQLAFSDLQKNFDQFYSKQDYLKAQNSLNHTAKVAESASEKSWIKTQQTRLDKTVAKKIESALKRGQISYSKGRIDEAISLWRQALTLDPDNQQLKESLVRANKFKQTYESLK